MRSWFPMILLTAATISGVSPAQAASSWTPVVPKSRSHSRNWPTERERSGAKATGSCESRIRRVTSSDS